jgi:YesN/AraC family two-component response regulator
VCLPLVVGQIPAAFLTAVAADADIDVLLTDVVMPGFSGPELIEQLIFRRPALKAVHMSGYAEDNIV